MIKKISGLNSVKILLTVVEGTICKFEEKMMSEHKHGSMDTKDQEKAFAGFVKVSTNTAIICIVLLVLVALINA